MKRLENFGTHRLIRYLPRLDPGTPARSTNNGFRWNLTSRNTMIVHAGGAMTGTKSTVSADRKMTRYHIIAYTFVQFGGKRHPLYLSGYGVCQERAERSSNRGVRTKLVSLSALFFLHSLAPARLTPLGSQTLSDLRLAAPCGSASPGRSPHRPYVAPDVKREDTYLRYVSVLDERGSCLIGPMRRDDSPGWKVAAESERAIGGCNSTPPAGRCTHEPNQTPGDRLDGGADDRLDPLL